MLMRMGHEGDEGGSQVRPPPCPEPKGKQKGRSLCDPQRAGPETRAGLGASGQGRAASREPLGPRARPPSTVTRWNEGVEVVHDKAPPPALAARRLGQQRRLKTTVVQDSR